MVKICELSGLSVPGRILQHLGSRGFQILDINNTCRWLCCFNSSFVWSFSARRSHRYVYCSAFIVYILSVVCCLEQGLSYQRHSYPWKTYLNSKCTDNLKKKTLTKKRSNLKGTIAQSDLVQTRSKDSKIWCVFNLNRPKKDRLASHQLKKIFLQTSASWRLKRNKIKLTNNRLSYSC